MKGIVAAGHEVTADAAAEILRDGGNAFDAVIAGLFSACVPETVLASIGGGGFLMARIGGRGETVLYDFFAQTPVARRPSDEIDFRAIHADFGPATQEFHIGAASSAVPGLIPGLFAIHQDLGSVPMERLTAPAIRAARFGVTMSPFHAYLFTVIRPILTASKEATALYAPGGNLLKAGEIFANPAFADTLEILSSQGRQYFVGGEAGQAMLAQSDALGGHLSARDLRDYQVDRRQPLGVTYRDHKLFLNPAPSAGGTLVGFGLALLERLSDKSHPPSPTDLANIMAETAAARARHSLEQLSSQSNLSEHLKQSRAHPPSYRGTTHISVIDEQGNAAAATISNGEGNGLMVGNHGFMLNNMLGEEDLNPEGFHRWQENTRMSSMMAPMMIEAPDGGLIVLGSGGSNRIRTALLQVVVNHIDRGMSLEQAINQPRLHVETNGKVSIEPGMADDAVKALEKSYPSAHIWPEKNMFFGGVHAAQLKPDGTFRAAGDPRRGGVVRQIS